MTLIPVFDMILPLTYLLEKAEFICQLCKLKEPATVIPLRLLGRLRDVPADKRGRKSRFYRDKKDTLYGLWNGPICSISTVYWAPIIPRWNSWRLAGWFTETFCVVLGREWSDSGVRLYSRIAGYQSAFANKVYNGWAIDRPVIDPTPSHSQGSKTSGCSSKNKRHSSIPNRERDISQVMRLPFVTNVVQGSSGVEVTWEAQTAEMLSL